ncbi:MAG TPA: dATP/dGTP pyrophosphohydrolase domain-containing protein [Gemmata sp.]
MSEAKKSTDGHTPGPWFVFGNGHCVGGPVEPGNGICDDQEQKTAGVAMCGMRLRPAEECAANAALIAQAPGLLAFKLYVHGRLDAAGVSVDPDGPHKAEGCRIGGRLDEALALFALAADQARWSQQTFGLDSERGPIGALKHLAKEVQEAEAAFIMNNHLLGDRGIIAEEFADCLLLLLDANRRAGLTPMQLIAAAQEKMTLNKAREWPQTVGDVPTEHVKEPPAVGKYGTLTTTGKQLHPGEPVFLLRATDPLAPQLVRDYALWCAEKGAGADHVRECREHADRIAAWQRANPALVKKLPT